MPNSKHIVRIVAVILTIVAILHLLRIALGWGITINDWTVPYWASVIAGAIIGYLAYSLWRKK